MPSTTYNIKLLNQFNIYKCNANIPDLEICRFEDCVTMRF